MQAEESYCECMCGSLRVEWETDRGWEVFGKSSLFLALVGEVGKWVAAGCCFSNTWDYSTRQDSSDLFFLGILGFSEVSFG